MRFELPRRKIDDQTPDSAATAGFELGSDQLDVWRPQQFRLRVQFVKRPFDEALEIAAQDSRIIRSHSSISSAGRMALGSSCCVSNDGMLCGDELRIRAMMPSKTFRSSRVSKTRSDPASVGLLSWARASFNNSGIALRSPLAALLTRCLAITSRFEIRLRLPFSVTVTRACSSIGRAVAKFSPRVAGRQDFRIAPA